MKRMSKLRGRALILSRGICRATAPERADARARSTGSHLRACLRSGGEGQSFVEFALVMPVMALILTGIFWAGMNMCNYLALNNAVDASSQYLKILGNTTGASTNSTLADPCQAVFTQMMGSASSSSSSTLNPNLITVTYTLNGSIVESHQGRTANSCTNESDAFVNGDTFTIVATYPCFAGIYGLKLSGCTLTVSSPPNQVITSN
jgi:Flp pilus assembly protein TadG